MSRKFYEKLAKGLSIYKQAHTNSIYVRIRINFQEVRKSLATSDIEEAKSLAWQLKFELEGRAKAGIPIVINKEPRISDLFNHVLNYLDNKKVQKAIYNDYRYVIKNSILEYFKNKTIRYLTTKNIRLYFESLELSNTRYNINKTCFNLLFRILEEENIMKKSNFPTLPTISKIDRKIEEKRDIFSKEDYELILKNLKDFHKGSDRKLTIEMRKTLYYYFIFLIETGIRPGEEIYHHKFSDIEIRDNDYVMYVTKGKTAKHATKSGRLVLLSEKAVIALKNIAEIQNPKKEITLKNFIFIDRFILENSNNKIPCYSSKFNDFKRYMKEKGHNIDKYVLYCCRHTYITRKIANGVDVYMISKQVGNSVDIIQKYYDDYALYNKKHIKQLTT